MNHAERKHALCSASSAERWLACPGSVALSQTVPEPPQSVYAAEGERFHELCELVLSPIIKHWNPEAPGNGQLKTISNMINSKDLDGTAVGSYPLEMQEYADQFLDVVWGHLIKYKPRKIHVEKQVTLSKELEMFGTADIFFAFQLDSKTILWLCDIKFGKGKVVEPDSPQLIYYAAAVKNTYPKVKFHEYWLHVFQPRAEHPKGPFRSQVFAAKEIVNWETDLIDAAETSLSFLNYSQVDGLEEGHFVAGDHCLFCNAKPVCGEYARHLNNKAGLDFTDNPLAIVPSGSSSRGDIRTRFSDDQISKLLTHKKEIERFLAALTEYAINRALEGDPIPGWKVVEGRSIRKWKSNIHEIADRLKMFGVQNPYDEKLRGITSIERELKKLKEDAKAVLADLTDLSVPGKTLAPEQDPRGDYDQITEAANDFSEESTE